MAHTHEDAGSNPAPATKKQPLWQRALIICTYPDFLIGRLIWVKSQKPIQVRGYGPFDKVARHGPALETHIVYDLDDAVTQNTLLCMEPKAIELLSRGPEDWAESVSLELFSKWGKPDAVSDIVRIARPSVGSG